VSQLEKMTAASQPRATSALQCRHAAMATIQICNNPNTEQYNICIMSCEHKSITASAKSSRSIQFQAAIIRVQVQERVQEFWSSHKQKYMQSNTFQAKS
jgi:hypothetical protein